MTNKNNDLRNKKYSDSWNYYQTVENPAWNSVYAWDLGFTHFISLNSNTDYVYVDDGTYATTDAFLQAQCEWLDEHLTAVENRTTAPIWIIIYMHLSPFTCVRTKRVQRFVPIFEKHKIPLVLCGHNHLYTRSIPLYTGYTNGEDYNTYYNFTTKKTTTYVDETAQSNAITGTTGVNHTGDVANGTHYVMCGATGYKTSGKETTITQFPSGAQNGYDINGSGHPWWNAVENHLEIPNYCTIKISTTEININSYHIKGVKSIDENGYDVLNTTDFSTITREKIDELTITKAERS